MYVCEQQTTTTQRQSTTDAAHANARTHARTHACTQGPSRSARPHVTTAEVWLKDLCYHLINTSHCSSVFCLTTLSSWEEQELSSTSPLQAIRVCSIIITLHPPLCSLFSLHTPTFEASPRDSLYSYNLALPYSLDQIIMSTRGAHSL